jgi:hypothetical protein
MNMPGHRKEWQHVSLRETFGPWLVASGQNGHLSLEVCTLPSVGNECSRRDKEPTGRSKKGLTLLPLLSLLYDHGS